MNADWMFRDAMRYQTSALCLLFSLLRLRTTQLRLRIGLLLPLTLSDSTRAGYGGLSKVTAVPVLGCVGDDALVDSAKQLSQHFGLQCLIIKRMWCFLLGSSLSVVP